MSEKNRGHRVLTHITILLCIFLIICTFAARTIANSVLPEVTVANGSSGTLDTALQLSGTVDYSEIWEQHAGVTVPVLELLIEPGESVSIGDAVIKLDLRDYQLQYERMQLSLDQLREDLNIRGLTTVQKDQLTRQIELAEAELSLYSERYLASDCIRADKSGMIQEVLVHAGQTLSPDTVIAKLIPEDAALQVTLTLPQELAQPFVPGDHVLIRYQDNISGSLEQLTAATQIAEKHFENASGLYALTIPAELSLLHPGQTVSIRLFKTTEYYANLVPRAAIQYDGTTGLPYIYTLYEREGVFGTETLVQRQDVNILNENELYAAIDSFNHADRVVISASLPITAGQKVRVMGD